ncbi:hypothetical protein GCM10023334_061630 [Nonomuraea thailandensis]
MAIRPLAAPAVPARGAGRRRVRTRPADLLHERPHLGRTSPRAGRRAPGLDRRRAVPHGPRHSDPLKSPYGDP